MATGIVNRHFRLNEAKIRRALRLLDARTETETIERALEEVFAERERNRIAQRSQDRFLRNGAAIVDSYGKLDG